jgi:hypothetical protein
MSADGSFSYVADPSFSGRDSFANRAIGGNAESIPATVSIDVGPGSSLEDQAKEWPIAVGGNGHSYALLNEVWTWTQARDRAA